MSAHLTWSMSYWDLSGLSHTNQLHSHWWDPCPKLRFNKTSTFDQVFKTHRTKAMNMEITNKDAINVEMANDIEMRITRNKSLWNYKQQMTEMDIAQNKMTDRQKWRQKTNGPGMDKQTWKNRWQSKMSAHLPSTTTDKEKSEKTCLDKKITGWDTWMIQNTTHSIHKWNTLLSLSGQRSQWRHFPLQWFPEIDMTDIDVVQRGLHV